MHAGKGRGLRSVKNTAKRKSQGFSSCIFEVGTASSQRPACFPWHVCGNDNLFCALVICTFRPYSLEKTTTDSGRNVGSLFLEDPSSDFRNTNGKPLTCPFLRSVVIRRNEHEHSRYSLRHSFILCTARIL